MANFEIILLVIFVIIVLIGIGVMIWSRKTFCPRSEHYVICSITILLITFVFLLLKLFHDYNTVDYYGDEYDIVQMAEDYNAKTDFVNCGLERITHYKLTDEWVYHPGESDPAEQYKLD